MFGTFLVTVVLLKFAPLAGPHDPALRGHYRLAWAKALYASYGEFNRQHQAIMTWVIPVAFAVAVLSALVALRYSKRTGFRVFKWTCGLLLLVPIKIYFLALLEVMLCMIMFSVPGSMSVQLNGFTLSVFALAGLTYLPNFAAPPEVEIAAEATPEEDTPPEDTPRKDTLEADRPNPEAPDAQTQARAQRPATESPDEEQPEDSV
ncbi:MULTISPECIES: hypothetical protein [unclassified Novosphingobium]|uniref:hypothetical protein n=1 Tax=unclassified Novosphingobium TaxID=2644732 RepID=UPI0006C88D75|nr:MULTISPECIES: hypothetical protein [unclassified Novosphingobium]KPH66984.1 hypothetical protein ADT71_03460 [Novosphingobium sp. ST904]MPS71379.1 hypothetical protein [Novosphingobium sp.]TCM28138.1 hypothetical protein EDF59_13047 [Novosphingobium sp. ST904]